MAEATINVKDAAGATKEVNALPGRGTAAAAVSLSTTLSTEDRALLDGIEGGLTSIANTVSGATPAGENVVGRVGGSTALVAVTLSLDTSAYAAGDVLAETQSVSNALRVNDGTGVLQSIVIIDQDDQGAALTLYLLDANVSMGTENSAPSITDANALNILAVIPVATSDYVDVGGAKIANLRGIGAVLKAATGTQSIYIAVVNGSGTPTYTSAGLKLRLGILQD